MLGLVFYFQLNEQCGFCDAPEVDDGFEGHPAAHLTVDKHGLPKLDHFDPVIYFHLKVLHIHYLLPAKRNEGEGEVTMCYGFLERAFCFCPFCINMYPLVIQGCIGKFVDLILRNLVPLGNTDFFAQIRLELCMSFNDYHLTKLLHNFHAHIIPPIRKRCALFIGLLSLRPGIAITYNFNPRNGFIEST